MVAGSMTQLGGSQFYRDRRERAVSTLCGAAATDKDLSIADGKRVVAGKIQWPVCQKCAAILAKVRA